MDERRVDPRARQELEALFDSWDDWLEERSWYLHEFVPDIVTRGAGAGRNPEECRQINSLRGLLDISEWKSLGQLLVEVADRRTQLEEREREREREQARERARQPLLRQLDVAFESDFLGAREWLRATDHEGQIDEMRFVDAAADYVTRWCKANFRSHEPDREQARVIASVIRHTLVEARAGSGKTATMATRAAFLIEACEVKPAQILMLAFNDRAAKEMRDRVKDLLPDRYLPHVMTFDALANRLVQPRENVLKDLELDRFIENIIDDLLDDPDWLPRIRDVMLAYFRQDWALIENGGDEFSSAEPSDDGQYLQYEALGGEFVKSRGEKLIANLLFENGYDYRYEHDVRWDVPGDVAYKPDFTIYVGGTKTPKVVIEYFGMAGSSRKYDEQTRWKTTHWEKRDSVTFRYYYKADINRPGFQQRLLHDLTEAGAPPRPRTGEEIWAQVKPRATRRFTKVIRGVIERARQRGWTGTELQAVWNKHRLGDAELDSFISISSRVLDMYRERLSASRKEDFPGVMWHAVEEVRTGKTTFAPSAGDCGGELRALRYIVVDEFQDLSPRFFALLQLVLAVAPGARLTAVGDDWQAINGFAGSSVEYFNRFEQDFPDAERLTMSTNRRSTSSLVDLGNSIMEAHGPPARAARDVPGEIREHFIEDLISMRNATDRLERYDKVTHQLLRLIGDHLRHGRRVAVLARTGNPRRQVTINGVKAPLDHERYGSRLRQILRAGEDRLQFSTVHAFKGDETDAVILLDATMWKFPLIHPEWIFFRVFDETPQSLTEADRRLFYVAISRARTHLDIVTLKRDESPFWAAARKNLRTEARTNSIPAPPPLPLPPHLGSRKRR